MKKKQIFLLSALLILCLFLTDAVRICADVIFEPEDSFYSSHADECDYLNRNYTANGDISYRKAPNASEEAGFLKNGTMIHISFVYTDSKGVQWGYFEGTEPGTEKGWAAMADLYLVYDSRQFFIDHKSEITSDHKETLPSGTHVIFWAYPQSETIITESSALKTEMNLQAFYTDPSGNFWGNCEYYMGNRDFWVCLTNSGAKNLSSDESLQAEISQFIPGQDIDRSKISPVQAPWKTIVIVSALLLFVIVASILLIRVFWKKKQ